MADSNDQRFLVWAIVASQFGPPFMFAGVAVALPSLGDDLHAGATSLGLVETLFLAGGLAFLLPIGRIADAGDKRSLYKLGLLTFGVTSALIGALSSVPVILAVRFLQGIASAVFNVTGPAILAELVPPERRGRVYGASVGAIYAGLTLGPVIAGYLIAAWGWRAVFLTGAAVILAGYLLLRPRLVSVWRSPGRVVHLPSTGLVLAAALCLVAGSATVGDGAVGYAFLLAGIAMGAIFVGWQRRLPRPLLDVRGLMGNLVLRNALAVQLLLYVNAFSSIFLLSIYMQVSLGASPATAGQVLAVGSILMAATAPIAGMLTDRFTPQTVTMSGVALVLTSAAMALALDEGASLWLVMAMLSVQGIGFALFASPTMTTIMGSVPASALSTASALGAKSRLLGMVAGMLMTTLLISLDIGNDPIARHPEQVVATMRTAFVALVLVSLASLALAWRARSGSLLTPSGG